MNQGEFRVYSPDGGLGGIDTIRVQGGRFEYDMECMNEGIIVIVLPNFYELPVFIEPGKTIQLRADASHIKDIEISGTDANDEMTKWRKQNNDLTIVQQQSEASKFISDNPKSIVSRWLLYKYFTCAPKPDYTKISSLIKKIKTALADDISSGKLSMGQTGWLSRLEQGSEAIQKTSVGKRLPRFTATDIYGKTVSSADYMKGYAIITVFTSYNFDSQNINRQLKYSSTAARTAMTAPVRPQPARPLSIHPDPVRPQPVTPQTRHAQASKTASGDINAKILTISLDASVEETKNFMHRDSLPWHVVCDQKMWDSPLVKTLGISNMPDNIIVKDGVIIGRRKNIEEIRKIIK